MAIEAVVFDIGGVLERNPRTGWPERWAERLGVEPADFEQRLDRIWKPGSVGTSTLEAIEAQTAEAFGLDAASLAALMDDAWAEYVGSLDRELAGYFAGLRPRYRTALLSNSFVGAHEREQALYGFEEMCDVIVYSHEVGCMKPDPRIYRLVCDRLGVAPGRTAMVDDLEANVDGARAVGMHAIRFESTAQAIAALEAVLAAAD